MSCVAWYPFGLPGHSQEPLLLECGAQRRLPFRSRGNCCGGRFTCRTPSWEYNPTHRPLPRLARLASSLPANERGDSCSASRQRGRPAETPTLHIAGYLPARTDQGRSAMASAAALLRQRGALAGLPSPVEDGIWDLQRELHKCCVGTSRRWVGREAVSNASGSCPSILRSERKTALQPPESDPPASGQDSQLELNLKDLLASDPASPTLGQLLGMVLFYVEEVPEKALASRTSDPLSSVPQAAQAVTAAGSRSLSSAVRGGCRRGLANPLRQRRARPYSSRTRGPCRSLVGPSHPFLRDLSALLVFLAGGLLHAGASGPDGACRQWM